MHSTFRAERASDQIDGKRVREPPLRLVAFPAADRYAPATPDDTVYALARFALLEGAQPLPEPCDPGDALDGLRSPEAPPEEWAATRARLSSAAKIGLPEHVTIDVRLLDGTVTLQIPTSSREAAWQVIDRAAQDHGGYGPMGPAFSSALDNEPAKRFTLWLLAERRASW